MDLAYDRTGSGEPLVLVHGLGHRRQGWNAVMPRLAAERDVIAVDLPAMGESTSSPIGDPHVMADMLEKLFGELGLERPHVAGNSLGGLIALELAARGAVRSATALSPAGFWNTPERWWGIAVFRIAGFLGDRLPDGLLDRIVANRFARVSLFGLFFGRPSRYEAADLKRDLRGLGREHRPAIDAALPEFKRSWDPPAPGSAAVPVTIGWGQRDLLLFPHQARRARRAFPNARFVPLPGLGHVPMADDPERVAALILEGSRG
ncbi:MAG: alpha/beta hydrolase [Actinobacteria bacterium]|nr:alpha/beta hydrolase [Actinomycetota bacterium]